MRVEYVLSSICFAFILFLAGPVHSIGTLEIGVECNTDNDCRSDQCETAVSKDLLIHKKSFCVCGEPDLEPAPSPAASCAVQYDGPTATAKNWVCEDGDDFSHDLNWCKSVLNVTDSRFSVPPTDPSVLDRFLNPDGAIVVEGLKANILAPQTRIKIPGLEFTNAEDIIATEEVDGNQYLNIPFFGEYLSAIYRYIVAMAGLAAVVMIIVASLGWITSGGSSEKIQSAKKKIIGAVIGLILSVGSYTLLSVINPDLVEFRNLRVRYIKNIPFEFLEDAGDIYVFQPKGLSVTDILPPSSEIYCPKSGGTPAELSKVVESLNSRVVYRLGGKFWNTEKPSYKENHPDLIQYNNHCPQGYMCLDCSGFINYALACAGMNEPTGSTLQIFRGTKLLNTKSNPIDFEKGTITLEGKIVQLQAGDLLGWKLGDGFGTKRKPTGMGHVILYAGTVNGKNHQIAESSGSGKDKKARGGRQPGQNPVIRPLTSYSSYFPRLEPHSTKVRVYRFLRPSSKE